MSQDIQAMKSAARHLTRIAKHICVECGKKITPEQVGRCVYAKECGHRQYSGKVEPLVNRRQRKG